MPERAVRDGGSYLLVLRLDRRKRMRVGRLGLVAFARGYYVYVGSAMRNMSARIAWHRRKGKRPRWHVDYLRRHADALVAIPLSSPRREECGVAQAVAKVLDVGLAGFGCSDCRCGTHLFRSAGDPLRLPSFQAVLQRFRTKVLRREAR